MMSSVIEQDGEATGLLAWLDGRAAAFLVDACASGAPPGTVRRFDVDSEPRAARARRSASTMASASPTRSSSRARSASCRHVCVLLRSRGRVRAGRAFVGGGGGGRRGGRAADPGRILAGSAIGRALIVHRRRNRRTRKRRTLPKGQKNPIGLALFKAVRGRSSSGRTTASQASLARLISMPHIRPPLQACQTQKKPRRPKPAGL